MSRKPKAPKNTPWSTIPEEDWAKGGAHVARLTGVTPTAARAARRRLANRRPVGRQSLPVPEGLLPTDAPRDVALKYRVSVPTAKKWLAAAGSHGRG